MAPVHHEIVHFSGRVQGVGFRFAAMQVAKEFEITGQAGNLPDGRVRVEVEGDREAVKAFLAALEERMHGFIRKAERIEAKRPPQFQGFSIQ
jgi:acylphosphatase